MRGWILTKNNSRLTWRVFQKELRAVGLFLHFGEFRFLIAQLPLRVGYGGLRIGQLRFRIPQLDLGIRKLFFGILEIRFRACQLRLRIGDLLTAVV